MEKYLDTFIGIMDHYFSFLCNTDFQENYFLYLISTFSIYPFSGKKMKAKANWIIFLTTDQLHVRESISRYWKKQVNLISRKILYIRRAQA